MADLVTLSHYEPAPRYYHSSQRVGQKVLVHGGWTKPEISDQSKQYLETLVEVFDPYSELWEQRQVGGMQTSQLSRFQGVSHGLTTG